MEYLPYKTFVHQHQPINTVNLFIYLNVLKIYTQTFDSYFSTVRYSAVSPTVIIETLLFAFMEKCFLRCVPRNRTNNLRVMWPTSFTQQYASSLCIKGILISALLCFLNIWYFTYVLWYSKYLRHNAAFAAVDRLPCRCHAMLWQFYDTLPAIIETRTHSHWTWRSSPRWCDGRHGE